jgi:hypothetical protein
MCEVTFLNEIAQGLNGKGKKLQSRIWFFSLVESENDIPKILENLKKCSAVNVFVIRHDKDKIKQDDGTTVPKRVHYHFAIRFDNPTLISTVANIFDFDVGQYNYIQRAHSWKASCRYMLHLDNKEKHLYDISEIQVIKGTKDEYYNVSIGKAQFVTTDADLFPDFGDFDKIPYKQQYLDIFANVDEPRRRNLLVKELETSWKNYLQKRRFEMESKNVKVIFVEGKSGSGKSTFAKSLAVNNHKTFCVSSSSNDILQDYTCEDYLILDDLRDTSFSFEDLLKLLDNFVISTVKSRYNNKLFLGEYIIITSAKPLSEWYLNVNEDRQQLFRRINMFARCHRNGNSLVADVFVPMPNEKAVDENGHPNGRSIPTPILELTPSMIQSVEDCWKALGLNLTEMASKVADEVVDSWQDDMKKK